MSGGKETEKKGCFIEFGVLTVGYLEECVWVADKL